MRGLHSLLPSPLEEVPRGHAKGSTCTEAIRLLNCVMRSATRISMMHSKQKKTLYNAQDVQGSKTANSWPSNCAMEATEMLDHVQNDTELSIAISRRSNTTHALLQKSYDQDSYSACWTIVALWTVLLNRTSHQSVEFVAKISCFTAAKEKDMNSGSREKCD